MIDFIKAWTVNIATLVILIVLLEIIMPSGKLKKVISLVAGFVLIIAIITPVLSLLKKGGELKDIQITQTAFLNQKDLEVSSSNMTKKQNAIIISTYKSKLVKDIEDNLKSLDKVEDVKAEVTVEEDSNSKEYGMIRKITVNVRKKEDSKADKPVIAIKKVEVGTVKESKASQEVAGDLSSEVKSKLTKLYNVSSDQIAIGKL